MRVPNPSRMLVIAASVTWLGGASSAEDVNDLDRGEQLFAERCAECHQVHPHGLRPGQLDLSHFPLDQRDRFENPVRQGRGTMPAAGEDLDDDEMDALWRYFEEVVGAQQN